MHVEKKDDYSYEKIQQIIEVSRYYYQDGLSQMEIAKKMGLSRPTISKALQTARESGVVTIKIVDPFENTDLIKQQLKKKYGLKEVLIASQVNRDERSIVNSLGEKAAAYLDEIVTDDDVIGINWGTTMEAIADHLHESQCENIRVVQLKGSVTNSEESNYSSDITAKFNHAFHTQANILPLPVIFGDSKIKSVAVQDQFVDSVIQEGYRASIALFTVGTTRPKAMLFRLGYLEEKEIRFLRENAVGDIVSHFITSNGNIADPKLDKRTVAIPLTKLKEKEYSILVAGGEPKLLAIHAALVGKYANVLIVDQLVAKKLLEL